MDLKKLTKDEIESMSYDDVAYLILKNKGKKIKLIDLFNQVCTLMNLDQSVKDEYVSEFFTLLSTDKRFISLDKGYWDLRENHTSKIELSTDEEDEDETVETIASDDESEEDEDDDENVFIDETKDIEDDEEDDEYKDLVIVDDSSEESDL